MFKKSLLTLSLILSVSSFAMDNEPANEPTTQDDTPHVEEGYVDNTTDNQIDDQFGESTGVDDDHWLSPKQDNAYGNNNNSNCVLN